VYDSLNKLSESIGSGSGRNTGLTAFPTLTIPFGGEYEAMGTAYTAVGRDSSYFDANPASSATLDYTELSLLHNNLIADANLEGMIYTMRFENLGLGAGGKLFHVPFTEYDIMGYQQQSFRYGEFVGGVNVSYNFFHSFNFHGVAVGANLKTAYRSIPSSIEPGQSGFGVMGDLGVLTRFDFLKPYPARDRNFSVGATLRNFGPPVKEDPLPTSLRAGIAYKPLRPVLLSFDLGKPVRFFSDKPVPGFEWASGISVAVTDFFGAQAGFHLKGGNPRFSLGSRVDLDNVRLHFNYTLDMTTQVSSVDRFSIQAGLNFGDRGRFEKQERVEEYYLDALVAFADGNIEKTIELCNAALELDPTFQPAQETKETAQRMQRLQNEMESIRLGEQLQRIEGTSNGSNGSTGDSSQSESGPASEPSSETEPSSEAPTSETESEPES
jgi:hypothetical protein